MLNKIIQYSLHNRLVVMIASIALLLWGSYTAHKMEVDVFPDLNAPTVVVMTEAQGMAPEEVERMVTFPIETFILDHRLLGSLGAIRLGHQYLHGSPDRIRKTIHARRRFTGQRGTTHPWTAILHPRRNDDFRVNCRQYLFTRFTDNCRLDHPSPFAIHGRSGTGSRDRW